MRVAMLTRIENSFRRRLLTRTKRFKSDNQQPVVLVIFASRSNQVECHQEVDEIKFCRPTPHKNQIALSTIMAFMGSSLRLLLLLASLSTQTGLRMFNGWNACYKLSECHLHQFSNFYCYHDMNEVRIRRASSWVDFHRMFTLHDCSLSLSMQMFSSASFTVVWFCNVQAFSL